MKISQLGIPSDISRGFLYSFLKAVTDGGPPGFLQLPPEGSSSLRRQKPDARNQTFGPISHVSGPKLAFWGNFIFVRYHFSARKLKSTLKPSKKNAGCQKLFFCTNVLNKGVCFSWTSPTLQGPGPGPYGPIWAHISDFWFNFVCFGFKTKVWRNF